MRALIRTPDSKPLTLTATFATPTPSEHPNHYIIRVKATSLTRGELTWPEPLLPLFPIPGYDVAGVVVSGPSSSSHPAFLTGDKVYALTSFSRQGNTREFSIATEKELSRMPRNLSWEEAASVPLSALSAYQALFVKAGLQPAFKDPSLNRGKRVLVTAASGGVGVWGVQLAHQAGAEVVATCGTSNVDFVKSLGADTVLDYSKTDLLEWVNQDKEARGFDVVLDCIGGQTMEDAWRCVRKNGILVTIVAPPNYEKVKDSLEEGVRGLFFIVDACPAQLREVTSLIEEGRCRGFTDNAYSLEQWKEAFERLESGHAKGKVVMKID
ncbi:NAD(P)-binding protein [Amniculicola lignicola CBS 123094]|uniref:NAD(P)-binding protein n=1 Tax=Amniculicola lignicola CBS 123094 TaxID=1392246 RepID=A0A6A5X4X0_9PLEO|nr:NAD(P)-binding protein [Amniculicola lignicola CBS 123094]